MAEKAKFDRSKPHVNIGSIGHVDQDVYKRQVWKWRTSTPICRSALTLVKRV